MITLPQIRNLINAGAFERLIERILANGRSGNLALRLRLTRADAAGPAALGLALQRACELAWGPCPETALIALRLRQMQRPDGWFETTFTGTSRMQKPSRAQEAHRADDPPAGRGTADASRLPDLAASCDAPASPVVRPSIPAAAVALRGLIEYRRLRAQTAAPDDPLLAAAIDRGLFALARAQRDDGSIGADGVDDAIILWQLGHCDDFRTAVRYFDFVEAVDGRHFDAAATDLRRLALAAAA